MKKNNIISIILIFLVFVFVFCNAKVSAAAEAVSVSLHIGYQKTLTFSYDGDLSLSYDEGSVQANISSVGNEYTLELTGMSIGTTSLFLLDEGTEKLSFDVTVEAISSIDNLQRLELDVGQIKEFVINYSDLVVVTNSGNAIMHSSEITNDGTIIKVVGANTGEDLLVISDLQGNVLLQLEVFVSKNKEFTSQEFIMATGENLNIQVNSSILLKAFSVSNSEDITDVEVKEADNGTQVLHVTALEKGTARVQFLDAENNVRIELWFYIFDIRGNIDAYVGQSINFNAASELSDSLTCDSEWIEISEKVDGTYTISASKPGTYTIKYKAGPAAYALYRLNCYQEVEVMENSPKEVEASYNEESPMTQSLSVKIGSSKIISFSYDGTLEMTKNCSDNYLSTLLKQDGNKYSLEIKGIKPGKTTISFSAAGKTKLVIEVTSEATYLAGYNNFNWRYSAEFEQHYQGIGNTNCYPTAITNVFEFYKFNMSQKEYTKLCDMINFDPNSGTSWNKSNNETIASFAKLYGKVAKVEDLKTWNEITECIDNGIPVLLNTPIGNNQRHATMVLGYYDNGSTKTLITLSGFKNPYIKEYEFDCNTFFMKSVIIY